MKNYTPTTDATREQLMDALKDRDERIEELEAEKQAIIDGGWRSCIDHIIRPDSPCPVCEVERLRAVYEAAAIVHDMTGWSAAEKRILPAPRDKFAALAEALAAVGWDDGK